MIAFICLFLPALISVCIYEKLSRKNLARKAWLYLYGANVLFINLFCFLINTYVFKIGEYPLFEYATDMIPSVACSYVFYAIAAAVVLAVAEMFCSREIKVRVEEDDHE